MTYRVYFNRCVDFPQVWSVDEGDVSTEINVQGISVSSLNVWVEWVYDPSIPTNDREPRAWNLLHCSKPLTIDHGVARFS